MVARWIAFVLLFAWSAGAQGDGDGFGDPPAQPDPEAQAAFDKGLDLQRRRRWRSAQKAFRRFMAKYPESPLFREAEIRGGDNCYLATESLWRGGPSERRIDVVVMGDGFPIDTSSQSKQTKWAKLCTEVLWHSKAYDEYRDYFNLWFVRLASLEEGVDPQLSPEQRRKIEEKNRTRRGSRRKKTDYNTALGCKAAGPQGQVVSDPRLVRFWLDFANRDVPGCGGDRQVIVFAQFGKLGMGGGGIANVGRPDKSITTHEVGHSFLRLLDEYTGNPNPPPSRAGRFLRAANISMSPDPERVPWKHFLDKRVKGVGIYEGGATYNKGVWRPARSCAMNAAGNTQYCPVCREQAIKVIYEYVNPIDAADPAPGTELSIRQGEARELSVTPMEPRRHKLDVTWHVAPWQVTLRESGDPPGGGAGSGDEGPDQTDEGAREDDPFPESPRRMAARRSVYGAGARARIDRSRYADPPPGKPVKWAKRVKGRREEGGMPRSVFPLAKLGPGTWRVIAQVKDKTKWVIKDDAHLLEERAIWFVTVKPAETR